MKKIKASNTGISVAMGSVVYNINSSESIEVTDAVASELQIRFGHLVEVTDSSGKNPETIQVNPKQSADAPISEVPDVFKTPEAPLSAVENNKPEEVPVVEPPVVTPEVTPEPTTDSPLPVETTPSQTDEAAPTTETEEEADVDQNI